MAFHPSLEADVIEEWRSSIWARIRHILGKQICISNVSLTFDILFWHITKKL